MIQKESLLVPCDKSGIWLVNTIHTYTNLASLLNVNSFGKCSVRITNTGNISQNNNNNNFLYVSAAFSVSGCGALVYTHNTALLLNNRLTPIGRRVTGFANLEVTRRNAISSFVTIL